ncbi:MAG TPA: protoporphyrinogen oxidase [Candidatus Acidoferrum sp.]|nr:protoporphyrinogen oxidase [Candidatus Acidoferrum sp.]
MTSRPLTIVVGGGISGLACAYALRNAGIDATLLEAFPHAGGVIRSEVRDGFLFEWGPQSFSSTDALLKLIHELGLDSQVVQAPPRAPRYVLINGKLKPVPLSPSAFLVSSLLSFRTKWSILREPLASTHPPGADESIADFVRRKFTPELLDHLVGPFVSGIYAGDPETLSFRAAFPQLHEAERSAGSLLRGMKRAAKNRKEPRHRPMLLSFRDGNESMVRILAGKLGPSLHCNVEVQEILRTGADSFQVTAQSPTGALHFDASRLVLSTPTSISSRLLKNLLPGCEQSLDEISYAPVSVVSLGYRRAEVGHSLQGFGFLVPRSAGLRTLGTVWNSSLFPGRAPQDHVLLTSFVGGATDPSAVELSPEGLADLVHGELSSLLDLRKHPVTTNVTRYRQAIPQYNLGHTHRLASIESARAASAGIWLIGNYFSGPAIGSCLEKALSVAEDVRMSYNS